MLDPELRLGGRVHDALAQNNVTFRPATIADCESLAPRLRKEDAEEALAASGVPAEYALKLALGPETFVAELGGIPEAIFGCRPSPYSETVGHPWMLGTPAIVDPKRRMAFLRVTRQIIDDWQARFPLLTNFIDARNTGHIRWLKWLGFIFIARHDHHGPFGLPFYEFVRITPCA